MPAANKTSLLFVSWNQHKVEEMRKLIPASYHLAGLTDIGWTTDIPEPYATFEENARAKVETVWQQKRMACFADDSGLEIDALDGRPGVYSARYAGDQKNMADNIRKVLLELGPSSNRTARFVAVIAYADAKGAFHQFKGIVEGRIAMQPMGDGGFGYDPIFIPDGFDATFAQLDPGIKHRISHRAKAMALFLEYLGTGR